MPPVIDPKCPHTVTHPTSTLQLVAQGPLTARRAAIAIDLVTPAAFPAESSTLTVNEKLPLVVGLPDTVFPDTPSPGGSPPPLIDQWYGGVPPDAPRVTGAYPTETSPL